MQTIIKNINCRRTSTRFVASLTLVSVVACIAILCLTEELEAATYVKKGFPHHRWNRVHGIEKARKTAAIKNGASVDDNQDLKFNDICRTPECERTAFEVLNKMKREIEPCDDFYQFACGNFIEETKIANDSAFVDQLEMLSNKVRQQLKDIITEERNTTEPKHFRLPNLLYKACMNEDLIESLGDTPIQQIADGLGGWPVTVGESWDSDNSWTWQKTVQTFRRLGFSTAYVVDLFTAVDLKNSTKHILNLDQSATALSREYFINGLDDTLVTEYYDYMVDIAILFGANKQAAKLELKESLQFEMNLANISWSDEQRRNYNDLYNLRSIRQLQELYPYIQWLDYINALLPEGVQVDENEIINLVAPSFFEELGKLLQRTSKRAIANYLMWRLHKASVPFLSSKFRHRELQYIAALSGQPDQGSRSDQCIDLVSKRLAISVASLYVRKYFKEEFKNAALKLFANIRDVFRRTLDEAQWMDGNTKNEAKRKLHAMTSHIGYPTEILDNDKLEEYYRALEINADTFFESVLNMSVFQADVTFSQLRLPMDKNDWIIYAKSTEANAFYSPIDNTIQLPAAILQDHFFNHERPMYFNYGAIGFAIGHEITHGFDDQGRRFDINGNLRDWWQPETENLFLEKAECIIKQYGNYTDKQTGLKLNGINTQGENIADNGGVKQAYLAYKKWVSENGVEPRLPGLNYTAEQLFYISFAQTWCSKYRTEFLSDFITTNVHSPGEFRILGSLSNMKEFSSDFQCAEGTPMNPVHKCKVW